MESTAHTLEADEERVPFASQVDTPVADERLGQKLTVLLQLGSVVGAEAVEQVGRPLNSLKRKATMPDGKTGTSPPLIHHPPGTRIRAECCRDRGKQRRPDRCIHFRCEHHVSLPKLRLP